MYKKVLASQEIIDVRAKLTPEQIIDIGEECADAFGCIPVAVKKATKEGHLTKTKLVLLGLKPLGKIPSDKSYIHPQDNIEEAEAFILGAAAAAAEEEFQRRRSKRNASDKSIKIKFKSTAHAYTVFKKNFAESRPALTAALRRVHKIIENNGIENPISPKRKKILNNQIMDLMESLSTRFPHSSITQTHSERIARRFATM